MEKRNRERIRVSILVACYLLMCTFVYADVNVKNKNRTPSLNQRMSFVSEINNLSIYDLNGRVVIKKALLFDASNQNSTINIDLKPGCYVLEISGASGTEHRKFFTNGIMTFDFNFPKNTTDFKISKTADPALDNASKDYHEIFATSNVFVKNSTAKKTEILIQKVLTTGYSPSENENAELQFVDILIDKDGDLVEVNGSVVAQLIADEVNAMGRYNSLNGLKRLRNAISKRILTNAEIAQMGEEIVELEKTTEAKNKNAN